MSPGIYSATSTFTFGAGWATDENGTTLVDCDPVFLTGQCFGATVHVAEPPTPPPPTATWTPTLPPTATPTPAPPITAVAVGGVAAQIDTAALTSPASTAPRGHGSGYATVGVAVLVAVAAAGGVWAAWRRVKPGK